MNQGTKEVTAGTTPQALFRATRDAWLAPRSASTRRSYRAALEQFLEYAQKALGDVTPADVRGWKDSLQANGLADTTVAQRLSALSSYFAYLLEASPSLRPDNPVDAVSRADLELRPYQRLKQLSPAALRALLAEIDTETVIGARDRAMLLFYVLCGSRRQAVVSLTGADLEEREGRVFYREASGSFPETAIRWRELPPPVWEAMNHYLALSGRTLYPDSPVFTATRRHDQRRPLSGAAVGQALKRYAGAAGLDPSAVNLTALRHLSALLFRDSGGNTQELQQFLNHAHLQTTRTYVEALGGDDDPYWAEMSDRIQQPVNGDRK